MKRRNYAVAAAAALLILASIAFGRIVGDRSDAKEEMIFRVERGSLEVKISEVGTLIAPRSVTIASEIQSNRAKVVRLTPEGTWVNPGDLLVEFDPTPFEEDVNKFSRVVKEAEATAQQVEQDAKLQKTKAEQAIADAAQRLRLAKLELRTLEAEGGESLSEKEARARVEQARAQLDQVSQSYSDAEALLGQGFVTRYERDQARARVEDARRGYELSLSAYDTLVKYRRPAEVERARVAVERATDETGRLRATAEAEAARQQTFRVKAETALEAARLDLRRAQDELAKAKIVAPASGFLIYNELSIGSEYRRIQIGDPVWNGQPIMTIPDTTLMAVETSVREFDVHKVHPRQKARVSFDAFPGLALDGHVDFIGNLATKSSNSRGGKEFGLRILLDGTDAKLRPGMTAQVDIDVDRIPDTLILPIEAIFEKDGRPYCYAEENGTVVEREIETGLSNADQVAIVSGLHEGQRVSLTPSERNSSSWLR